MIKKFTGFLVLVCMCVLVTGCGETKKVKEELVGVWVHGWYAAAVDLDCYSVYDFGENDKVTHFTVRGEQQSKETYGTYSVEKDVIVITMDDGQELEFEYTYENDELKIVDYGDGTVENEYLKIDKE